MISKLININHYIMKKSFNTNVLRARYEAPDAWLENLIEEDSFLSPIELPGVTEEEEEW